MNTFEILLNASKQNASIRIWGLAQKAYGNSRITYKELGYIQIQLRDTDPDFFKAK